MPTEGWGEVEKNVASSYGLQALDGLHILPLKVTPFMYPIIESMLHFVNTKKKFYLTV